MLASSRIPGSAHAGSRSAGHDPPEGGGGTRISPAALLSLARVGLITGDLEPARAQAQRILCLWGRIGRILPVAHRLEMMGTIAIEDGQVERAMRLTGAAGSLRRHGEIAAGTWEDWIGDVERKARGGLAAEIASAAWAECAAMTASDDVEYALAGAAAAGTTA